MMKKFLTQFSKHKTSKTIDGDTPKSPSIHTNDSTASETSSVNSSTLRSASSKHLPQSSKILDLSLNYDQLPVQPNIVFPYKTMGKNKRSFNNTWYKQYPWIEYSIKFDEIYC